MIYPIHVTLKVVLGVVPSGPMLAWFVKKGHQVRLCTSGAETYLAPHIPGLAWNAYPFYEHGDDAIRGISLCLRRSGLHLGTTQNVSFGPQLPFQSLREENLRVIKSILTRYTARNEDQAGAAFF